MGISGADLLIACVGAGLRAYTKFAKVEYANGAEVPAEHFLREVESLVLENIIAQLAKITGGGKGRYSLTGIDAATRFYIFWRFTYRNLELDAGEAIIFSYGAHVELDGANGLSAGSRALVEKKKSKYKLRDFTERGEDDKLGIPREDGQSVPLIDTLHRMLWLMDNRPAELPRFLQETKANKEQLRLVAQMLAGTGLKGGEMSNVSPGAELSSLSRLIANWKSIVDEVPLTEGQKQLDFWEKK
jgi:putative DNA methylase